MLGATTVRIWGPESLRRDGAGQDTALQKSAEQLPPLPRELTARSSFNLYSKKGIFGLDKEMGDDKLILDPHGEGRRGIYEV